jgi:hypothetical protein
MSDIPRARAILESVLRNYQLPQAAQLSIAKALSLMQRDPPIRRARAKTVKITPAIRARVRKLAGEGYSQAEIARAVGLPNAGRVSEILNGKR